MRKITLILSFLIVILTTSTTFSQEKICDNCKKSLKTGQYLLVEGKHFHEECFTCGKCRMKIEGSYSSKEGKFYHQKCYKELYQKKCSHCRKGIEGEYFVLENKIYHQSCYDNFIADRCNHCDKIIKGEYFNDYWGNKYHYEHYGNVQMCDYCQKLISYKLTGGSSKYGDGRVICRQCKNSAVSSIGKAQRLLDEIQFLLRLQNIVIDVKDIELHLVDLDELRIVSKNGSEHSNLRGYAAYSYRTINDEIVEKEFDIYILTGMPESYYKMVAAHELMHIWQYANSKNKVSEIFSEGSCEYASYLILKQINNKYSKFLVWQLEENKDPVYGAGFRKVKNLVDKKGKRFWLDQLKTEKDFPVNL